MSSNIWKNWHFFFLSTQQIYLQQVTEKKTKLPEVDLAGFLSKMKNINDSISKNNILFENFRLICQT